MNGVEIKSVPPAWYKRWEIWGTILLATSSTASIIMLMFPEIDVLYRLGGILGALVGLAKTIYGLIKGYGFNNLSKSITDIMDKIPDKYTGKKGALQNGYNS